MSSDFCVPQTISELISSQGGSIKTGPFGTALKASEYASEGVPLISVREIGHGDFHIDAKTPRVNAATVARLPEYVLAEGDIVFARKGGIERCALVRKQQAGWFLGSDGIRLRPPKTCDARFLAYALQTSAIKEWLLQHSTGSTMASLNQATIGRLPICLPNLHIQGIVADTLELLDDRISLLREASTTLEAIAQALFKSWFVDFDPVRSKMDGLIPEGMNEATAAMFPNTLVESELGTIPNGWRVAKLHSATSAVFSGGTPDTRRPEFWEGDIPWFSSGETRNLVIVDTEKRITKAGVDGSSTRPVLPGDILIASAGQGHTRGQTSYCGLDCYINQSVVALRAGELCKPSWLFCNLVRRYEEMRNLSDSHSSRGSLTTKLLNQMPLVLPPLDIIDAFDNVASTLLTSIISNVKQVQSLSALRDTLLPRLISGQVNLPDIENQIEAIAA